MTHFSGSYDPSDVTFLLTPLDIPMMTVTEKEKLLVDGRRHYSEVLSAELPPSQDYLVAYRAAVSANSHRLARDISRLSAALAKRRHSPAGLAIVSFARAGTPIGVLLARSLRGAGLAVSHYSISIVRDRGIDEVALCHILERHSPGDIVFLDGWTGKGTISKELRGSEFLLRRAIKPFLAVVADPAGQANLAATGEDYLIPSGILNGIISGLISRSVITPGLSAGQFHGCRVLHELAPYDISRSFVEEIDAIVRSLPETEVALWPQAERTARASACAKLVARLQECYNIPNVNRIKPGIAEATRAVLRREPREVLISGPNDGAIDHLVLLCTERNLPVKQFTNLEGYRAVALLR